MHSGRLLGLNQASTSSQVATLAIPGGGLIACPVAFGYGPASFMALYRMAYERALASVAADPSLYERLMNPCWN